LTGSASRGGPQDVCLICVAGVGDAERKSSVGDACASPPAAITPRGHHEGMYWVLTASVRLAQLATTKRSPPGCWEPRLPDKNVSINP
jgi:hypothetical protein